MTFNIIERIANELVDLKPNVPIYREQQRGGFQEPSFFINKITTHIAPNFFGIQVRDSHYEVIYFPTVKNPNMDMDMMEAFLTDNFNQLEGFAVVHELNFERSDGALVMTFRISLRAIPIDEGNKQQTMDYQGGIKHG